MYSILLLQGEQSCGETILTSHEYPDLGDNQNILMTPEDLTIVEKFHNPTGYISVLLLIHKFSFFVSNISIHTYSTH